MTTHFGGRACAAAVFLALTGFSATLQAQEVQGPPDGFRAPQDGRAPAQGPADNGIPPIAVQPRTQPSSQPVAAPPREQAPSASASPSAAPAVRPGDQRSTNRPPVARPQSGTTALQAPILPIDDKAAAEADTPTADAASAPADSAVAESLPQSTETVPVDAPAAALPLFGAPFMLLLGAAILCVFGGFFLWWRRRAALPAVAMPVAVTGDAAPVPHTPPAPQPPLAGAAPPQVPVPVPTAPPAPAVVPQVATTGRARLTMTLQVTMIEVTRDSVHFGFALLLANSGDRAASGGLVRIALQQAHANQAAMLHSFFGGAGGSLLAENVEIAAGDVGTLEGQATLPLGAVEVMMIGGYPSLVPVMGLDVTYHWDGEPADGSDEAFGQVAAAFVVGGQSSNDGRIAAIRLDLGPRRLPSPSSRVTELQQLI